MAVFEPYYQPTPLTYTSTSRDSSSAFMTLLIGGAALYLFCSSMKPMPTLSTCASGMTAMIASIGKQSGVTLIDDDSKAASNGDKLRKLVGNKDKNVILLFAHWCPHCKTAREMMEKVAAEKKGSPIKFVMVNAEAVESTCLSGADAIFPLEYFPTVLANDENGTVTQCSDIGNAVEVLENPNPSSQPADTSQEEIFQMLF